MIGLEQGKVMLKEYDPDWANEYLKEKENLEKILAGFNVDIQHIGSTSVKGCAAKPIIDISIGVESLEYGKLLIEPLEKQVMNIGEKLGFQEDFFLKSKQERYKAILFILSR